MTVRFGLGDQYMCAFPPGRRSSDPSVGDEPTFQAREDFVDMLQEEAREAYDNFRLRVEPTFREVFDAPPGEQGVAREAALKALLKRKKLPWEWPPEDPTLSSPYAEAFGGWPPPTPRGAFTKGFDCWRFHGWLLASLLGDELYSWSKAYHLEENLWVASHLLARRCKARLLFHGDEAQHDVKLDHVVFGSPGALARFKDSLDKSFGSFRDWDPTQEEWGKWRKTAEDLLRKALADHRARVLEECEGHHLAPTPEKREPERDFRRLVRFQVLGLTQVKLREKNEDVRTVRRALKNTAGLVGLKRRTPIP